MDIIRFEKEQRKDDITKAFFTEFEFEFEYEEGIMFVGRAQEKANVFQTEKKIEALFHKWLVER